MVYRLKFLIQAEREWHRLNSNVRAQFKKKLLERLESPRVPSARLSGHADRYKIKLRSSGYRLVYEVRDKEIVVVVVAVGRRDKSDVYMKAAGRTT